MANEANIIKIKRSGTSGAPASLKLGELAYSYLAASGNPTSNGGDRLFIGANGVNVGTGNANDVVVIGGKYFTDLLDHERGILTASSALIVNADKKLDELLVDNLSLNGNSIITTDTNGDLTLAPNGTGSVLLTSSKVSSSTTTGALVVTGGVGIGGAVNAGGTLTSTAAGSATTGQSQIYLNGATSNRIDWAAVGTGAPAFTTRSDGTKLLLYPTLTGSLVDYAIGIDSATMWSSIPENTDSFKFKWYGATTEVASLSGVGKLTVAEIAVDDININGNTLSTTNGDLDVILSAHGTGNVQINTSSNSFTLPNTRTGTTGYVLTANTDGTTSWSASAASLGISADSGADSTVDLLTQTFDIAGSTNISTSVSGQTVTITLGSSLTGVSIDGNAATADTADKVANALTLGTNLLFATGSDYDGSSARQIDISSSLTDIDSISSSAGTGDVTLNASGGHSYVFADDGTVTFNSAYTFPAADGTAGYVLTTNGIGTLSWAASVSSLSVKAGTGTGDTGSDATINLLTDSFKIKGNSAAITTALTVTGTTNKDYSLEVSARLASTSVTGVASFSSNSFDVSAGGEVTVKTSGISNTQLANSSFYIGTTTVSLGAASGSITSLAVDISGKATTAGTADKVANSVTFAATGGAAAGATFDGAAAKTVDYSTIGAAPAAGSSSIVTVGALTSGSIGTGFTAIPNTALANSSVTVGSTSISLGATSTSLTGLTQIDVDNITINGNEISSTNTDGNISLNPNGTGTVAVNSARITGLADPTDAQDAATKAYVDARSAGLDPKASVRAATTENITLSNTQTVDGVALAVGDRVLVKNQTTASQNGIYIVASGAWARSSDMDEPAEMTSGVFFFVEEGTANADAGFVITTDGGTIVVGTDAVNFTQFSGAGQLVAGDGLSKTGNTLAVNVAANGGIEISADALQLKSTVAGNGLTYTNGVVDVAGTTDRISVSADAIDIASTYVGQTSITTLGTIGTGTWNGSLIGATYGGTGVNNGSNTITIGGNVSTGGAITFSGAYAFTGTLTAATSVTFPTTGTLVNKDETTLSSLSTVGTIGTGTWQGSVITYAYGGTGQSTYAKGDLLYASAANTLSKLTAGTNGQMLQLQDGLPIWADMDGGSY